MTMINPQIEKLSAYKPPLEGRRNFKGMLLDFNERTIPASPKVRQILTGFLSDGALRIYPEYFDLNSKIVSYAECKKDQVMLVNGSDQGIDLIFRAFTQPGDSCMIPNPSFAMFRQCAQINGVKIEAYNPTQGQDYLPVRQAGLKKRLQKAKLIIICNPNNPTGSIISIAQIEQILKKNPDLIVFVDEAYYEFSKVTAGPLIKKYPNLIVSRTFSKAFGLSALRIGYLISQKQNIEQLLKVRGPYDVNFVASLAASAALDDLEDLEAYVDEVMNRAKPLVEKFFTENGIKFYASSANFILFEPENSRKVYETLKDKGVLTRPREKGTIRLSIGTFKQMQKFIQIYKSNFLS